MPKYSTWSHGKMHEGSPLTPCLNLTVHHWDVWMRLDLNSYELATKLQTAIRLCCNVKTAGEHYWDFFFNCFKAIRIMMYFTILL